MRVLGLIAASESLSAGSAGRGVDGAAVGAGVAGAAGGGAVGIGVPAAFRAAANHGGYMCCGNAASGVREPQPRGPSPPRAKLQIPIEMGGDLSTARGRKP